MAPAQLAWPGRNRRAEQQSALLLVMVVPLGLRIWAIPDGRTAWWRLGLMPLLLCLLAGLLVTSGGHRPRQRPGACG